MQEQTGTKCYAVINRRGGSVIKMERDELVSEVRTRLEQIGLQAEVDCREGEELADAMQAAAESDAEILVVGGGDGTVRYAARTAMDNDMALMVLPMGTINIFARDLQLPMDWREAIQVMQRRRRIRVDTARMNDEVFLCQSSIGLVPRLAEQREEIRSGGLLRGIFQLPRRLKYLYHTLRRNQLRIETQGESLTGRTWLAVISNNLPDKPLSLMPQRSKLDDGKLVIYWANIRNRAGLFWLSLFYLLNLMAHSRQIHIHTTDSATVTSPEESIKVGLDGEVMGLSGRLEYRLVPRSLTVLVPEQSQAG